MTPFARLTALAVPFDEPNVDTNQICPTRFNKVPRGPEYQRILFHDRRFNADGTEKPDFILNRPPYREAQIIVADRNFGCGSSRETAVYALTTFGFKAVIASSYGDIFFNNCFKNGVLPIILPNEICVALRAQLRAHQGAGLTIDLDAQTVTDVEGKEHRFDVHPLRKKSLISGLDDIALTTSFTDKIVEFETAYKAEKPWLDRGSVAMAASFGHSKT
jgi:3-isopropylmalate/(R)-2-methylmalate dehydratase small subunit